MDWRGLLEQLRTENILSHAQGMDPIAFLKQPEVIVVLVAVLGTMLFLKMIRSFAVVVGLIVMWMAVAYFLPETSGAELQLSELGPFAGICLGVAATWIYLFFVKAD